MEKSFTEMKTEAGSWSVKKDKCIKCGACVAVCPFQALELIEFPEVNSRCTFCNICSMACPVNAIAVEKK